MAKDRENRPKGISVWNGPQEERDPPTEEVARRAVQNLPHPPARRRGETPRKLFDYMQTDERYAVEIDLGGRILLVREANGMNVKLNELIGHSARDIRSRYRVPPLIELLRSRLHESQRLMVGSAAIGTVLVCLVMLLLSYTIGLLLLLVWLAGFFAFVNVRSTDMAPVLEDIDRYVFAIGSVFSEQSNLSFELVGAFDDDNQEYRSVTRALRIGQPIHQRDEIDAKGTRRLLYKVIRNKEDE